MKKHPENPEAPIIRSRYKMKKLKHIVFILSTILMGRASTLLADTPPNIVFILADDMGIGDASCYNPESKISTPNIDRLAKEGMRFTDAHAPGSICVPSRYGLLTGRYPFRKWSSENEKIIKSGGRDWVHYGFSTLQGEEHKTTIASLLKANNYDTACFGKWHLGMGRFPDETGTLSSAPIKH